MILVNFYFKNSNIFSKNKISYLKICFDILIKNDSIYDIIL